jgi:hypothetical protein
VSAASITVPSGATKVNLLRMIGWNHTWSTDSMVTLQDPSGQEHLIYEGDGGSNCGGCGDDFNGDYEFVDAVAGAGTPCMGGNPSLPACGVGTIAPGRYLQSFGTWPSGSSSINNTLLEAIPVSSGTWTLRIYDWCVQFDSGSLVGWELCFDSPSGPTSYCTAGTSTNGCVPAISANDQPSVSLANPCVITVANVEGQKNGIVFYGTAGPSASPWGMGGTSFLCVKAPTQRTPPQMSGGTTGACDGQLTLDWNAYQSTHPGALGNPWSAGDMAWVQAWYRDPPAVKTTNLSGGLELTYKP